MCVRERERGRERERESGVGMLTVNLAGHEVLEIAFVSVRRLIVPPASRILT